MPRAGSSSRAATHSSPAPGPVRILDQLPTNIPLAGALRSVDRDLIDRRRAFRTRSRSAPGSSSRRAGKGSPVAATSHCRPEGGQAIPAGRRRTLDLGGNILNLLNGGRRDRAAQGGIGSTTVPFLQPGEPPGGPGASAGPPVPVLERHECW